MEWQISGMGRLHNIIRGKSKDGKEPLSLDTSTTTERLMGIFNSVPKYTFSCQGNYFIRS